MGRGARRRPDGPLRTVNLRGSRLLALILPPLLYAAVQRTSWRQFAANRRPIFLLAVALVFVTTAGVAAVSHALVPGLGLAGAVALGALVAPPDPVAATTVAGQLGLPRRLVSILEGEGLFNDVTAITLYHVAVAAAVTGTFSFGGAVGELVLSAVVAVLVGLALGWAANKLAGTAERIERARTLHDDHGADDSPDREEEQPGDDEEHEPEADPEAREQPSHQ